jgi:hypothetical protein
VLRLGQLLSVQLERPAREAVVAVPFRAVYGGGRLYVVEDGRMRGVDVESLGTRVGHGGEERLLVQSDALAPGDALVTTHMPNAIEGLRVEIINDEALKGTAGGASEAAADRALGHAGDAAPTEGGSLNGASRVAGEGGTR